MFGSKSVPHGFFSSNAALFSSGPPAAHEDKAGVVAVAHIGRGRTHRNAQNNIIKYILLQDLSDWSLGF
jgi:hypothetical protein